MQNTIDNYFKLDSKIESIIDNTNNEINIYTDGSAIRKQKKFYCGYGIYIPCKNIEISKTLQGTHKTNNRAELTAIIEAIKMYKNYKLNIYTDSTYSILIFTTTGKKYKKANFKDSKKKDILNKDLVTEAVKLSEKYNIKFHHIRSHTNKMDTHSLGNKKADQLATHAAELDYKNSNHKS